MTNRALAIGLILLCGAAPLLAEVFGEGEAVTVVVDPAMRSIRLPDRTLRLREGEPNVIYLSRGDEATVKIAGYNPLFFTYSWDEQNPVDTLNYAEAKRLADMLKPLASQAADKAEILSAPKTSAAPLDITTDAMRGALQTQQDQDEEALALERLSEGLLRIGWYVDSVPVLAREIAAGKSLDEAKRAQEARIQALVRAEMPATPDVALISASAMDPRGRVDELKKSFAAIDAMQIGVLRGRRKVTNLDLVFSAKDQQANVESLMAHAIELNQRIDAISSEHLLGRVPYRSTQDLPVILRIEPRDDFITDAMRSPAYSDTVKQRSFTFSPRARFDYDFGPAAIYSWRKTEEWATEPVEGGHRIVRRDDGAEYHETQFAAAMTVTPRAWRTTDEFSANFLIGVVPESDELGILLGAGFSAYDLLTISVGATWQKGTELAATLQPGQVLSSPDLLRTKEEYELAPFVGITLQIGRD